MESSEWQATVGKGAGSVVTDRRDSASALACAARHFAKIITNMVPTLRIHHGGVHGEKAGAARHAGGMPGAAAKQLKKVPWKQQIWLRIVLGIPKHKRHSSPNRLAPGFSGLMKLGATAIVYSYLTARSRY